MGLLSELQFSRDFPTETNPKALEHWDFFEGGRAGGSHGAKSETLGCVTVSSLRGWKGEALDKGSLPSWGFSSLGFVV